MITEKIYNTLKDKYSDYSSWAIWNPIEIKDLTIFDVSNNKMLLESLQTNIVFVGLNTSGKPLKKFSNFHASNNDAKIRDAFINSTFYGGYMTDIIKDFKESKAVNTMKYLKEHPEFEYANIKIFKQELKDLEAKNIILLAFGKDVYKILQQNSLDVEYQVIQIPHYSARLYNTKDSYIKAISKKLNIYKS